MLAADQVVLGRFVEWTPRDVMRDVPLTAGTPGDITLPEPRDIGVRWIGKETDDVTTSSLFDLQDLSPLGLLDFYRRVTDAGVTLAGTTITKMASGPDVLLVDPAKGGVPMVIVDSQAGLERLRALSKATYPGRAFAVYGLDGNWTTQDQADSSPTELGQVGRPLWCQQVVSEMPTARGSVSKRLSRRSEQPSEPLALSRHSSDPRLFPVDLHIDLAANG